METGKLRQKHHTVFEQKGRKRAAAAAAQSATTNCNNYNCICICNTWKIFGGKLKGNEIPP